MKEPPMIDRDTVIALAHRNAWRYKKSNDPHHSDTYTFNEHTLLHFANLLIRQAVETERKKHQADIELWKAEAAKAELWRGRCLSMDHSDGRTVQQIQAEAIAIEREACAQVVDAIEKSIYFFTNTTYLIECAAAIRARGTASL